MTLGHKIHSYRNWRLCLLVLSSQPIIPCSQWIAAVTDEWWFKSFPSFLKRVPIRRRRFGSVSRSASTREFWRRSTGIAGFERRRGGTFRTIEKKEERTSRRLIRSSGCQNERLEIRVVFSFATRFDLICKIDELIIHRLWRRLNRCYLLW